MSRERCSKSASGRNRGRPAVIWTSAVAVVALIAAVIACTPQQSTQTTGRPAVNVQKATETPEADEYGVVLGGSWAKYYPYECESYMENRANSIVGKQDYLQVYPEITILGKGYGYAKYYTEPASHLYSIESISNNGRISEKSKAGCIACKSPQFMAQVMQNGPSMYALNFLETIGDYSEPISCYNCHMNDPFTLAVTRPEWTTAMGEDADTAPMESQVCGQCHCDYSMSPEGSVPTSPYDGVDSMTPERALKWYNDNGYVDWTYESTGAKMIAVRHAEYEYVYGGEGNHMASLGYQCMDCHMGVTTADDGTVYTSHYWRSPLENQELIDNDCSNCHTDLAAQVEQWQTDLDGRTHQVGLRCVDFVQNFEDALAAGTLSEEDIARLQDVQRSATYYWNFVSAENSEGAHNPTLTTSTLDLAEAQLDIGDEILGVVSDADNAEVTPGESVGFAEEQAAAAAAS